MSKRFFLHLALLWILSLLIISCGWKPDQYYETGFSDEDYITIARSHHDAELYLAEFPDAEISVDRSGRLAVDFRVTKNLPTDSTQNWEGIRLRVFINPNTNQPTEAFIQCNDKIVTSDLEGYLEQYLMSQSCP